MRIERLTSATTLPFTVRDLATHLRADGGEFLWEVTVHGKAAATELESYAQLALLDQTIRVTLDGWPRASWLELPIAPLLDVLTVTITADGVAFTEYATVAGLRPAIRLTGTKPCGLIVVEYQAGFGPAATDIPDDLALAIMDQAASSFDARGEGDGKSNGMSPHMARIAARYRRVAL